MRLHGNIMNRLAENVSDSQNTIKVGDGATVCMYSDRHACTIVEIKTGRSGLRTLIIQEDTATRVDGNGMSDAQSYSYSPNPQGRLYTFTERKGGTFKEKGGSYGLALGSRRSYHDYSF